MRIICRHSKLIVQTQVQPSNSYLGSSGGEGDILSASNPSEVNEVGMKLYICLIISKRRELPG